MSTRGLHRTVGTAAVGTAAVGAATLIMLAYGWAVRLALIAALAFYLALVPVVREHGLANLPFVVLALALLQREYPRTVPEELRARFGPARRTA